MIEEKAKEFEEKAEKHVGSFKGKKLWGKMKMKSSVLGKVMTVVKWH